MTFAVDPRSAVHHRQVFELRYERGELYWDHCGRIVRKLAAREGWAIQSIDTNGCHVQKDDQNLVFSFSPTKLDLNQSQNEDVQDLLPPAEFAAIAEEFSEAVVSSFEVDFFPRMGFRRWLMYPTASLDEASSAVSRMSFFGAQEALTQLGALSFVSHSVIIARPNNMVRVAATPFEQQVNLATSIVAAAREKARGHWKDQRKVLLQKLQAKKVIKAYPPVGVMIDMDASLEDLRNTKELAVCRFIAEAMQDFDAIGKAILSEAVGS